MEQSLNILDMQEPFDIELYNTVYSVFPEEKNTYTIFKEGKEYIQIIWDDRSQWLKANPETGLPMFGMDEEVNLIGQKITEYIGEE